VAMKECKAMALAVLPMAPWALAAAAAPALLRLRGWHRATAAWIAAALAAEGAMSPTEASLTVVVGMAATHWAGSACHPAAFETWKGLGRKLRKLPLAVVLASPVCIACLCMMLTSALALLDATFQRFGPEPVSSPAVLTLLHMAFMLLTTIPLTAAFFVPWHAVGMNYVEDGHDQPERSLFNCMQVVVLQVAMARICPGWSMGGYSEMVLLFSELIFWAEMIGIIAFDRSSTEKYRSALRDLVLSLGGPRGAIAQVAMISGALAALVGIPMALMSAPLLAFFGHSCWSCAGAAGVKLHRRVIGALLGAAGWAAFELVPLVEAAALALIAVALMDRVVKR